tara:strand:- start:226 stop:816 length:591 start_codon:yes stop_codon:yes gene_type:complete
MTKLIFKYFLILLIFFNFIFQANSEIKKKGIEDKNKFKKEEIIDKAKIYFADLSEGVAIIVERSFSDFGLPSAYIEGEEFSAAFFGGLRYGKGKIFFKDGTNKDIYWNGPSIGFDFGANASKVFTLVYNIDYENYSKILGRFPEAEGNLFIVAGLALNYQKKEDVIITPIRSGIGLRAGVNMGYINYTKKKKFIPF